LKLLCCKKAQCVSHQCGNTLALVRVIRMPKAPVKKTNRN